MNIVLGLLLMICGASLGIYVGGYLMLFGGIADIELATRIIWESNGEIVNIGSLVIGICKMMFAGVTGAMSTICLILPGQALLIKRA